jgi:hypothetical protein
MKPNTKLLEVLLLSCAMFLSGCWWFGDGRYRDQLQHPHDHHEQRDPVDRPSGSR